jgi:hypothetical protein
MICRVNAESCLISNHLMHMLAPLLFAVALSGWISNSNQSDTIPNGHEQEASMAAQVFRDHYIAGYYQPFGGSITRIAAGTYRLDSFTMQMDTLSIAMIGLLSRGLLFPGRLAPFFGSTDTLSIGNLYELNR